MAVHTAINLKMPVISMIQMFCREECIIGSFPSEISQPGLRQDIAKNIKFSEIGLDAVDELILKPPGGLDTIFLFYVIPVRLQFHYLSWK